MKARIEDIEVEGSPSELGEFLRSYRGKPQKSTKVDGTRPKKEKDVVVIPFSKHRRNKTWTAKEDKYLLKQKAAGRKNRLIAKDLGRTTGAVTARLHDLRTGRISKAPRQESRQHQHWTPQEEAFLKRSITDGASLNTIAKHLGRSKKAIRIRAQRHGWKKSDEVEDDA